jgi:hypothetical protein
MTGCEIQARSAGQRANYKSRGNLPDHKTRVDLASCYRLRTLFRPVMTNVDARPVDRRVGRIWKTSLG